MNKEVYDLAHKFADEWCYKNQLIMIGAKKIDNYIYVRGFDGGFPHAAATAKFDIDTGKFVEMLGFYGCPVTITEGTYE